jgi:hypothetical protein
MKQIYIKFDKKTTSLMSCVVGRLPALPVRPWRGRRDYYSTTLLLYYSTTLLLLYYSTTLLLYYSTNGSGTSWHFLAPPDTSWHLLALPGTS